MIVTRIGLRNFRNHSRSELSLGDGVNALLGNNGQGKTNILESISYLGLTKSFFGASDSTVLQIGQEYFEVDGTIRDATGQARTVRVRYDQENREKSYTINASRLDRLSSAIGEFPTVVLSPDHDAITAGPPGERRRFMDILLSQISRSYLEDLLEYRRVLRQRNRILTEMKISGGGARSDLEAWTASLLQHGGRLQERRTGFVREFRRYIVDAYAQIAREDEDPGVQYIVSGIQDGETVAEKAEEFLAKQLGRTDGEERRRGTTLVGPHRDDLHFRLAGRGMQEYGSQGQHKTFLIALKVAEYFYVRERRSEVPIFLLDDVFSELDAERSRRILEMIPKLGQTVITATEERLFQNAVRWDGTHSRFWVEKGTVRNA
jgi:DNA replication and repair protein RecF